MRKKFPLKIIMICAIAFLVLSFVGLIVYSVITTRPENIRFTNISSSSITVSWTTKSPTRGTAFVSEKETTLPFSVFAFNKETSHDTRDIRNSEIKATNESAMNINSSEELGIGIENFVTNSSVTKQGKYYVHHVEITKLKPDSSYYVYLGDGIIFRKAIAEGTQDTISTISVPESIPTPIPAYGSIKNAANQELTLNDLYNVTDAIVYLNYLDQATGERSDVYSAVVNSDGNWYMDISTALDSQGNYFRDKFNESITNLFGEIEIQTSTDGLWKKTVNIFETAPSATIVLNDPQAAYDEEDNFQLKKIRSSENNVLTSEVSAQAINNKCEFKSFCGDCVRRDAKGKWESCTCDTATLKRRGCTTQKVYLTPKEKIQLEARQDAQLPKEDRIYLPDYYTTKIEVSSNLKCAGGYSHDEIKLGPTNMPCVKCDGRSGLWVKIDEKNCKNLQPQKQPSVPTILKANNSTQKCNNPLGCICEYGEGRHSEVEYNGTCRKPEYLIDGGPQYTPPVVVPEETKLETGVAVETVSLLDGEICGPEYTNGCICKRDPISKGKTCTITQIQQISKTTNTFKKLFVILDNFVKGIYAQEENPSEFVIDQTSGIVAGLRAGVYVFDYEGKTYYFLVKDGDIETNPNGILVYIDKNDNKVYDENIDQKISDFGVKIKITPLKEKYDYSLKNGFNFVTIPFVIEGIQERTAAGLLQTLNKQYGDSIYSIAKYDGNWKVVGQNTQVYQTNDFQLVPGQGYIIKANKNVDISIIGYPIKFDTEGDSAAITLYQGWNLIGTYGSNVKQYTAKTLIEGISNYKPIDFTADNVSRWESDVQRYDGLQITNQNGIDITYGFDFPINNQQAYFVRILQGKGNWQPELKK